MSSINGKGKVEIILKDDLPCFFTVNPKKTGRYYLTGTKLLNNNAQVFDWSYENSFEVKSASKDSCILWGEQGFHAEKKYLLNTPYDVTFSQDNALYLTTFCIGEKEGKPFLQEVRGNECYEQPKGVWQLIKEALNW